MRPKHTLAGWAAALFGRPSNSVPLRFFDHGDKYAPMERTIAYYNAAILKLPPGAFRYVQNGERVNPHENREIMSELASPEWWESIERDGLNKGVFA